MEENLPGSDPLELGIKFDGGQNLLDARTYAAVLRDAAILVEEAGVETGSLNRVALAVRAEKPGSFVTLLTISLADIPLFQPDAIKAGALALATALAALKLWRDLKRLTPKSHKEENDEITIETEEGEALKASRPVFDLVSSNERSKRALEDAFKNLERNPSVTKVTVLDEKQKPILEIPREEFKSLSGKAPDLLPEDATRVIEDIATVTVVKLSFDPDLVWEIIYAGDKRSAYIVDPKFWARVKNRDIPFLDGDELKAHLKIPQKWSVEFRAYVNSGPLEIIEVHDVIHHPRPPSLF
jgi:hypothetical protein